MRKRFILMLAAVAVVAAAIVVAVLLRHYRPPEAARLLPAADAYLYFDLATMRRGAGFRSLPQVEMDPEYANFVRETGFQFERDLDEAAFAVHLPRPGEGSQPASPSYREAENRYSEVFVARFDRARLAAYLHKLAGPEEQYRGTTIYAVPLPGRTVRVAILSKDMVAASNTQGPYLIQGMIDRQQQLTVSTPDLLRAYYGRVPMGSLAWAIARIGRPGQPGNSAVALPGGFNLFFPAGTVMVGSVRYLGAVHLRAQAIAPSQEAARTVFDQLSAFLALFRTLETQAAGSDRDVKEFFDSFQVTQDKDVTSVTATVPPGFAKKLLSEAPATVAPKAEEKAKPEEQPQTKTPPRKPAAKRK
jgi:hypothetical protein